MGNSDWVPGSWLWPGLTPASADIGAVNQQTDNPTSICLFGCFSNKTKINKQKCQWKWKKEKTQIQLSDSLENTTSMQAVTEQYSKEKERKSKGGKKNKKQRNDYYQNGKCYSQFTSAAFNYFSPNHKRTIKIKVLATTSLCSFVSSHRLVIISFSGREILGRWWGRTGVPGPGRPRFLLESHSFPWSKAKVLTKKEHL